MDAKINEISEALQAMSADELDQISHVIDALRNPERGLHYNGTLLGINVDDAGEITMQLGKQNSNFYNVAQGGAIFTLADIALGNYIMTKIPKDTDVVTLELKMNYIRPGKGEKLYAKPSISHMGKNTVVADCTIIDENEKLVAKALGTFFLKSESKK
ncbi:PaaI family thioesterase [Peribacillus saganii]|nr:PaaI family thioesterase [Peribacillus saganii]